MYRVFIVEDDEGIARGMRDVLESWGMQAACAQDFRDVMGEFSRFSPHIVLMDITLPYFNGYHTAASGRWYSRNETRNKRANSKNAPIFSALERR